MKYLALLMVAMCCSVSALAQSPLNIEYPEKTQGVIDEAWQSKIKLAPCLVLSNDSATVTLECGYRVKRHGRWYGERGTVIRRDEWPEQWTEYPSIGNVYFLRIGKKGKRWPVYEDGSTWVEAQLVRPKINPESRNTRDCKTVTGLDGNRSQLKMNE